MTQHKWHKEIKAWADGAEIEYLSIGYGWQVTNSPEWCEESEYRIKPQPKEKKYLYVYKGQGYQYNLSSEKYATGSAYMGAYIGKIEVQDD